MVIALCLVLRRSRAASCNVTSYKEARGLIQSDVRAEEFQTLRKGKVIWEELGGKGKKEKKGKVKI